MTRPLLRTVLATIVVVDLISFYFFLGDARTIALAEGLPIDPFSELVSRALVRGGIILIGVASAVAFARRPGRLWEGTLALAGLILLSTAHAHLFGSPWRHLFYSGLCLLGWLLGLAVSRRGGAPRDESYARIGSIALLGAAYLNAGVSKLAYGGGDWISGTPIQAVILGQDGLVGDGIVSLYRSWVVATPWAAGLFSFATVGFELAGPLMLVGRRVRLLVTAGLLLMHANIYLLTDILYWESMVFLVVFGLSWDAPTPETLRPVTATRSHDRRLAGAAVVLATCALLAIVHQSRRFAHPEPASAAASVSPEPPPIATPMLRQIGPFTLGQTVGQSWSVESFSISDGGFVAVLSGGPGRRAAFEVTCARTEHRSPFDLGAAHVFYSSDLDFPELEDVGREVQQQVRQAAAGHDICEQLATWRRAAMPPR